MLDGMTNIKASEVLKELKYYTEDLPPYSPDEVAEALEMAIKALEQQPSEDCIRRQAVIILIDEASEMHPYKVVGDSDTYSNYNQGWSDACDWLYANIEGVPPVTPRINLALTSQDCISREEIKEFINTMLTSNEEMGSIATNEGRWVEEKTYLHGVEILEGLSEYVNDLPSVTPKYTDEEIDKAQAVEQAYVDKMVELAVEESRQKWLESFDTSSATKCFEAVNLLKQRLEGEDG